MLRAVVALALCVVVVGISVALRDEEAAREEPDRIASVSRTLGIQTMPYYLPLDFSTDPVALNPAHGLPGITTFCHGRHAECALPPSWPPYDVAWVVSSGSLQLDLEP